MSDDQPEERQAARVITVNPAGQALLFETWDPDRPELPTKWISPGGGVDDGESLLEAAARELLEETGMTAQRMLGPLSVEDFIWTNQHGRTIHQFDHVFVGYVDSAELSFDGWTAWEREFMTHARWWDLADLEHGEIRYYPKNLLDLVRQAAAESGDG